MEEGRQQQQGVIVAGPFKAHNRCARAHYPQMPCFHGRRPQLLPLATLFLAVIRVSFCNRAGDAIFLDGLQVKIDH
jgi:hypothetical protein